ncbi:hypothetical protein ASD48_38400 [Streptomyces sp. Root1310]|nr:hypothetical protein ASD48_38400 [Streptomyces sp. Root1310]
MHHWQTGLPPWPYFQVLRWHAAQGPTWLPRQTNADGSGSAMGGGGGRVLMALVSLRQGTVSEGLGAAG